ncbi:SCP2 sterol-binding domain-containing protein [Micromonospora sp. NPDC049051]|uniref:SCP2 sterol-binding domain-containing protein n=1 Tax=Micromonospora sp. NPDC049051 TaxID=3364264 RepID=UPI0037202CA6
MADATTRFLEDLDRREYEPLLAKSSGSLRLDLHEGAQTTHWLLRIDRGRVRVSQDDREADTVVGVSPALFEDIAAGREGGVAAMLRGDVTVTGDLRLLLQVERLFPSHPDARGPNSPYRRMRAEREVQ